MVGVFVKFWHTCPARVRVGIYQISIQWQWQLLVVGYTRVKSQLIWCRTISWAFWYYFCLNFTQWIKWECASQVKIIFHILLHWLWCHCVFVWGHSVLKSFVLRIKLEKKFELFKPKAFTMTTSVVVSRPGLGLGLGLKTIFADIGSGAMVLVSDSESLNLVSEMWARPAETFKKTAIFLCFCGRFLKY